LGPPARSRGASLQDLSSQQIWRFGRAQAQPAALGGSTQSAYVVVSDADEVYRRAKAAGAKIVIEIKDEDYSGRGFSCRDPEGHLWNVGTYEPWRVTS
jgi:uncharacterized glyoxalase superfamily protein PhnB